MFVLIFFFVIGVFGRRIGIRLRIGIFKHQGTPVTLVKAVGRQTIKAALNSANSV